MNPIEQALDISTGFQSRAEVTQDWANVARLHGALEAMSLEGAVVVLRLDGPRHSSGSAKKFTVVLSGGGLGEDYFHIDAESMSDAVSRAINYYDEKVWKRNQVNPN